MDLQPSQIFYSQDSIHCFFDKRSSHNRTKIEETLDNICEGRCQISSIPTITVKQRDGKWVTADNRRLWVFRELERLGKCDTIPVRISSYIPAAKLTSFNGGTSVLVRGPAGGYWHNKPTPPKPPDYKAPTLKPHYNNHLNYSPPAGFGYKSIPTHIATSPKTNVAMTVQTSFVGLSVSQDRDQHSSFSKRGSRSVSQYRDQQSNYTNHSIPSRPTVYRSGSSVDHASVLATEHKSYTSEPYYDLPTYRHYLFTIEDDYDQFTTEDDYDQFTTEYYYDLFTTEDDYDLLTTEKDYDQFTTEDDYDQFMTEDNYDKFMTDGDFDQFMTEDDFDQFTNEEDYDQFTTEYDYDQFMTEASLINLRLRTILINLRTRKIMINIRLNTIMIKLRLRTTMINI